MGTINISLPKLFAEVFGYESNAFKPEFQQQPYVRTTAKPYPNELGQRGSKYVGKNPLTGLEYYMPVKLGGLELHHPVVRMQCRKTIISTPLVERQGTVKELINIDDWDINIKGIILLKEDRYPEDEIIALRDLWNRNEALPIECPITDIFLDIPGQGFADVVIKNITFPEVRGVMNARAYEISLESDSIFSLEEI